MKTTHLYVLLIVIVIGGLLTVRYFSDRTTSVASSHYDVFAQCLADSGARFFGAFWCPHCRDQKTLLRNSSKLPYIECSTPDQKNQTLLCIDENITGYPTWKFADGSVIDGVIEPQRLSEITGCELPL